jgi:hypothetical protein
MLLQLAFDDQWIIPIPIDARLHEALEAQVDRAIRGEREQLLLQRLGASIAIAIDGCLDADLKLPTDAQLKYATDIARELNIALPGDALRFRGAIAQFIERFSKNFQASRERHRR